MLVKGIKEQSGTLKKLQNLLKDDSKKVHGVFYTNSTFSQRYLSRSHTLVENLDVTNNEVKLNVSMRLEQVGLMEVETTLDVLVKHQVGDLPGFAPEGIFEEADADRPRVMEPISVKQNLYSVDILLILKDPRITYQEFTIAGSKFTLINLHKQLEEDFDQTVTLLFGDRDKMYLFSHLYNKDLTVRDMKLVLDLIVDENITGKAFTGVKIETSSGASSNLFPMDRLIDTYTNSSGDYVFSTLTGYVKINRDNLADYKFSCEPQGQSGAYQLVLKGKNDTIRIYTE